MPDAPILGRLLILSTTAAFAAPYVVAAEKLGVAFAVGLEAGSPPHALNPTETLSLRFAQRDSALEIVQYAMTHPLAGIVAADEPSAPSCARATSIIGLRWHMPKAADACLDKFALRQKLANAGLRTPLLGDAPAGRDLAVSAIVDAGKLRVLGVTEGERAVHDAPRSALEAVFRAAHAVMLRHGPVYAQLRVTGEEVWLLDLTPAIPLQHAQMLKFRIPLVAEDVSLAEVVVRHALGMDISRAYRQ